MIEDKLGPVPEPMVEAPADNPGGADALNDDAPFAGDEPGKLGHDLHPDENPGVEDAIPEEIAAAEDKQQENEGDGASEPEKEAPA